MNKKVYARQIPPEYQESPLFIDDSFWPDGVITDGNRDYNSRITPAYETITASIDNAAGDVEEIRRRNLEF